MYLEDHGITDRATVVVDAGGIVRFASSVTPSGERKIDELLTICEKVNREYSGASKPMPQPKPLPDEVRLYVKSNCGFSRAVALAVANLHLEKACPLVNVTENAGARAELAKRTGKETAPCLMAATEPMFESKDIIRYLVEHVAPVPS